MLSPIAAHLYVALNLALAPGDVPTDITGATASAPPGSGGFTTLLTWVLWLAFAGCVAGVAKAGGLLAWAGAGRSGGGEHGMGLVFGIAGAIVTGSAAAIVTAVA